MEKIPCQFRDTEACPIFRQGQECFEDAHHLFWPKNQYAQGIESRFRNLGENLVRMCRNLHNIEHHVFEPPDKPDLEIMRMAVQEEKNRRKDR